MVEVIAEVADNDTKIVWDIRKPNWITRKLMDTSNLYSVSWKDHRSLFDGISHKYELWLRELLMLILLFILLDPVL